MYGANSIRRTYNFSGPPKVSILLGKKSAAVINFVKPPGYLLSQKGSSVDIVSLGNTAGHGVGSARLAPTKSVGRQTCCLLLNGTSAFFPI